MEAACGFQPDSGPVQPPRELEAERQGEQKILAAAMVALADRKRGGKDGAGCMRAGQRFAFERADHRAVGERGARHVGLPGLVDDRDLRRAAQLVHHLHPPPRPRERRADECGGQRIEQRDPALGDQAGRQIVVSRLGDESGEDAGCLPRVRVGHRSMPRGPARPCPRPCAR